MCRFARSEWICTYYRIKNCIVISTWPDFTGKYAAAQTLSAKKRNILRVFVIVLKPDAELFNLLFALSSFGAEEKSLSLSARFFLLRVHVWHSKSGLFCLVRCMWEINALTLLNKLIFLSLSFIRLIQGEMIKTHISLCIYSLSGVKKSTFAIIIHSIQRLCK